MRKSPGIVSNDRLLSLGRVERPPTSPGTIVEIRADGKRTAGLLKERQFVHVAHKRVARRKSAARRK